MSGDPTERYRVLRQETCYDGFFLLTRYHLQHVRHDGGWTRPLRREVFERGRAVMVLPYDPLLDRVILIEQFRAGALAGGFTPWIFEAPAGLVGEGENAADVARREAKEETGCQILELIEVGRFLQSPGSSAHNTELFIGRVDSRTAVGIHGLPEEDEDIRVHVFGLGEAIALVGSPGKVNDYSSAFALFWLAANRERVRRDWGA
jgi:ADP-ribose pyrophosphatase